MIEMGEIRVKTLTLPRSALEDEMAVGLVDFTVLKNISAK